MPDFCVICARYGVETVLGDDRVSVHDEPAPGMIEVCPECAAQRADDPTPAGEGGDDLDT